MDIGVPSRFACLKIEDESVSVKPKDKKSDVKKTNPKKTKEVKRTKSNTVIKKEPNKINQNKDNRSSSSSKKDKKKEQANDQWEEWKEKDSQIVNGHYEQDLQNAILLSKLDYEEKKEIYKQQQKEAELEKSRAQNKKKKNKAMSLDQFLGSKSNETVKEAEPEKNDNNHIHDESFFEKIKQEAQEELTKEQIKERRKKREEKIDQVISMAQLQEKWEAECRKNELLRKELQKAKAEIAAVKERNKSLCDILGHGEMKDKADVLLELERLNLVKNELTEEVARLYALLEQERSKVAALTSESQMKHKDKKSKKNAA